MDVNVFTAAMRAEFLSAMEEADPAVPAPWEGYTSIIDSTARIENYAWMTPSPGIAQYQGHRRLSQIDSVKYSIENLEYDASFEVLNRDIADDQVGGYKMKPRDLAKKAQLFPGRLALKTLALAKSTKCFDGTNFAADSHTIGTGDNLMAYNLASNDAATYKMVALVNRGPIKPIVYQNRKAPVLQDDAGSSSSGFAKKTRFWVDMEGACGFGYWWDAIWVDITDTPVLTEVQTILGDIENRFRTFKLPKALTVDDDEYVHEQTQFDSSNLTIVASTGLGNLLRQALNQDWVPMSAASTAVATTNLYKGFANLVLSAFLN